MRRILICVSLTILIAGCVSPMVKNETIENKTERRSMRPYLDFHVTPNRYICLSPPDFEKLFDYVDQLEWVADTKIFKGE